MANRIHGTGKPAKFDLSDQQSFEDVLGDFGGEEYLRERFPEILRLIHNTRTLHIKRAMGNSEPVPEIGVKSDVVITIQEKNTDVKDSGSNPNAFNYKDVEARSETKTNYTPALIIMNPELYNIVDGKRILLDTDSVFDYDSNTLVNYLKANPAVLFKQHVRDIFAHTISYPVSGEGYILDRFEKFATVFLNPDAKPVISSLNVIDPHPKTGASADIRVVYGGRHDTDAVYIYPKAHYSEIFGVKYVTTCLQFKLEITLADDFAICADNPFDIGAFSAYLKSSALAGQQTGYNGYVFYNSAKVKENIKADVNGNKLTLYLSPSIKPEYPEFYWYADMQLASITYTGALFDFHVQFYVNYTVAGAAGQKMQASILVSSEDDCAPSPTVAKTKKIHIQWGCLGENTIVKTLAGDKRISEVAKHDSVLTENGKYLKIVNVVTGTEDEIVLINAAGRDPHTPLLISKNHLIKTKRGTIPASELNAADDLDTGSGTYAAINDLRIVRYFGKVYSLELEEPAYHYADGFLAASYNQPPVALAEIEKKPDLTRISPALAKEIDEWVREQQIIRRGEMIKTVKDMYAGEWLKFKDVHGVGIGLKCVGGKSKDELAITVFTTKKKPAAEIEANELLPAKLGDISVDVVETPVFKSDLLRVPFDEGTDADTGRYRPALGGIQISLKNSSGQWVGTLGTFVKSNETGRIYILSNRHVLDSPGLSVFQPDSGTAGNVIATVSIANRYSDADAGIAESNLNKEDIANCIQQVGQIKGTYTLTAADLLDRRRLVKRGRTTFLTEGTLVSFDVDANEFRHQCVVRSDTGAMSEDGDSGAAVLTKDNKIAGLLWGGNGRESVFSMIDNVFSHLNISLLDP